MRKRSLWMVSPIGLILVSALAPLMSAQTAAPKSVDEIKIDKWNSVPLHGPAYTGLKPAPAPRRDLSGVWDATGDPVNGAAPGIQASGANEHRPCCRKQQPSRGRARRETYPESPALHGSWREATLEAHKPTGLGVRSVPAIEGNDPVDICDPPGFPRMDLSEFRTLEIAQAARQSAGLESIFSDLAHHLDRWPRTSHGSRTKVLRLLGRQMGGRLHVCGSDGGDEPTRPGSITRAARTAAN